MLRRILLCCLALAAAAAFAGPASAATPHYYLALGDSLAQGMQPDVHGVTRDTTQGYADDLFATERAHVRGLQLVKLGCGYESSTSMLTGKGNAKYARALHCDRAGGSQLAAAVRFLKAHHSKGEVPLVTIDIGANDVDGCGTAPSPAACAIAGIGKIDANVPKILRTLRAAAPKGTTFAGMTLYDPLLAGYFDPTKAGQTLYAESIKLAEAVNASLAGADKAAGFKTADVAGAFHTYDNASTVPWEGQSIPVDVARVCSWTWACSTPPSGPNIHANKNGYEVIAGAFAKAIGRLH